jgi:hypothetical protein
MPILYMCDGLAREEGAADYDLCRALAEAQYLLDDQGVKRILPPFHWRVVDVPGQVKCALLCPECRAKYELTEVKMEVKPPRKFGVIDGGKGSEPE